MNKGPGRPYFNDQMRTLWLTALSCVDYVVVVPFPAAVEAIECVRPDIYCKGREYADGDNDVTGNIRDDVEAVRRVGGKISYVGSIVFSSSRLLNSHFDTHPPEVKDFCRQVASICPSAEFRRIVDDFSKLRVLIVGDIIFDRYTTVEVQGLTSKNRILSGRFVSGRSAGGRRAGGIPAHPRVHAARQAREPGREQNPGCRRGCRGSSSRRMRRRLSGVPYFTTVVKQRFVEPKGGGQGAGEAPSP